MIRVIVHFHVPPERVYKALMDESEHSRFTGAKAVIENKTGGRFSVWDGYATGIHKVLIPGKKIVQSWAASDWPAGTESEVTFVFTPEKGGTKLVFTHKNVPEDFVGDIRRGWDDYYWGPMEKYFKNDTP